MLVAERRRATQGRRFWREASRVSRCLARLTWPWAASVARGRGILARTVPSVVRFPCRAGCAAVAVAWRRHRFRHATRRPATSWCNSGRLEEGCGRNRRRRCRRL